jgi:hypothetical protein
MADKKVENKIRPAKMPGVFYYSVLILTGILSCPDEEN